MKGAIIFATMGAINDSYLAIRFMGYLKYIFVFLKNRELLVL
jgi:hypothetical protein